MASNVGSRAFQNARLQKQFRKEADVLLQSAVAAYRSGSAMIFASCGLTVDGTGTDFAGT